MIDQAGLPSYHDLFPDRRAACNADLCHDDAVFSYRHVVGDLNQIVDFGSLLDVGAPERGPVNSHIGPDFDVIFNDHDSPLWNLMMAAFVLNVPEAITPNDGSRMDDHPGAYPASVQNAHVRMEHGIMTDGHVFS